MATLLDMGIRELKSLVLETRRMTDVAGKTAERALSVAENTSSQVEQLRELVLVARNEQQEFRTCLMRPCWKKTPGIL